MRAAVYHEFGPPEVLQIEEQERPEVTGNDLLIRIRAATVDRDDTVWREVQGYNGVLKPKRKILGMYFAGEVVDTGPSAKRFRASEQVFGYTGKQLGGHAEYICISENEAIAKVPPKASYQKAAGVLNGALTAIPYLRDTAKLKGGERVLVYGASGSVGIAAMQIGKALGAEMTGACSSANIELVESLSAGKVLDYEKDQLVSVENQYDIIFDTVGELPYKECRDFLRKRGLYLSTMKTPDVDSRMRSNSIFRKHRVMYVPTRGLSKKRIRQNLEDAAQWLGDGKLRAVIDRTYTLQDIQEAHRYVETKRKRGAVIIEP